MLEALKKHLQWVSSRQQHNIHSHPTPETMRRPEEEGALTQTPEGFLREAID